jgi:hypothetical protein
MTFKTSQYNTVCFSDIYQDKAELIADFRDSGFPSVVSEESLGIIYLLLYGRYANNPIANYDINQWKIKLFSIIYQHGPIWEKRLEIQEKLRKLDEKELLRGSKAINNSASNPDTAPGTASLEELAYINNQTTQQIIRSKLDVYMQLWDAIALDITDEFLGKFKSIFKVFVKPESVLLYGDSDAN